MSSEPKPPQDPGVQREADIYDLLAWLEVNKKKVGMIAVLLVVLGFGIAWIRYSREQKELKASTALLELRPALTPSTNVPPPQPSALLKVAETFKGTSAAERAEFLAATALFTEEKYSEAEALFSRFLKEHPDSPWRASAALGLAASQEAQNKINEAMAAYQSVITAHGGSAVADEAKLALARLHEARNQPDQALRLYNELLAPKPGARPGQVENIRAQDRKEALLRAHPELNTNLTSVPSPATQGVSATSGPPALTLSTNTPAASPTNAHAVPGVTNVAPAAATNSPAPAPAKP